MAKELITSGRGLVSVGSEVAGSEVAVRSGERAVGFSRIIDCINIDTINDDIIDAEFEESAATSANAANAAVKLGFDLNSLKSEFKFASSEWIARLIEEFQFLNKITADEADALRRELGL